jgi:hypothetical protein
MFAVHSNDNEVIGVYELSISQFQCISLKTSEY